MIVVPRFAMVRVEDRCRPADKNRPGDQLLQAGGDSSTAMNCGSFELP